MNRSLVWSTVLPYFFLTGFLAVGCSSSASTGSSTTNDIAGIWKGLLNYPVAIPGERQEYSLRFDITQINSKVLGTSRIEIPGTSYFAVMVLSGEFYGNRLQFAESGIRAENPPPGDTWCLRHGTLEYRKTGDSLTGTFESESCPPGEIRLHRVR